MYKKFLFVAAIGISFAIGAAQGIGYADETPDDIIYTKPLKAVTFSHKDHVEKNGLSCDMCHDDIFQMDALSVQNEPDFTMAGLAAGKWCGACHDGSTAFDSDSRCASCHSGVKGLPEVKQESHK